jgi:hypothetical protein
MPTSYTSLLGLALPATGELSGSWGTTVNNSITELVEDAIAASATASVTSADWTLSTTGSGAVNEARCAILIPTGTPGVARNINAPNTSKAYIVVNQSNAAVTIRGVTGPTTGVSIAASARALVAWNGSDFVVVSDFPINISSGSADITGTLALGNGGSGQTTAQNAMNTFAGAVTSGQYLRGNGTNVVMSTIQAGDVPTLNQNTTGTAANVTGIVAVANGGTGVTTAQAEMNRVAGAVTNAQYLRGNGTNVVMSAIQAGDVPTLNQNTTGTAANVTGTVAVANGGTGQTTYTDGQLLIGNTSGNTLTKATLTQGSGVTITNGNGTITIAATGSGGTITSVGATAPVASSGGTAPTISLNANYGDTLNPYASKTANFVLAAPNGSAGAPTFRAVVAADIPTLNQNTTGTAGNVTGTVAVANGGTGGTTQSAARTNLGATTVGANVFTLANPSAITFPRFNADNTVSALDAGTFRTAIGAGTGSGTVTSVGATSPVASSGGTAPTISLSANYGDTQNPYASKTANNFLAAPNGSAGAPTFRAIVAADIPTLNQNTTGTAGNVTGTVAVANGGSGTTTAQGAMNTFAGGVTSGSYLRGNGTNVVLSAIQAGDVPTLNQNTTGTAANVTGTVAVANGGTGGTTQATARSGIGAAASGANTDITALDQDITITATGTIAADTIGYRGLPINTQSGAYTFAQSDAGKHVFSSNAGAQTLTVPTNASVAIAVGTAITVVNNGTTAITFTTTGTTVYKAGTSTAWASGGTLAVRGLCTWLKVATDTWFVNGAGLS